MMKLSTNMWIYWDEDVMGRAWTKIGIIQKEGMVTMHNRREDCTDVDQKGKTGKGTGERERQAMRLINLWTRKGNDGKGRPG